jgi:glycosyltransferase involved in cell wall biosynthesis
MLPKLVWKRPDVIYLGEYPLYCWLFKVRKFTGLRFRLVLYTGGQAIPGKALFNPATDFIHHITDVYLESCKHFPAERQRLIPHFVLDNFSIDKILLEEIKWRASGKKIVLSVGAIEKSSKRMHCLVEAMAQCRQPVFPVLLGEPTADWDEINSMLIEKFGKDGFVLQTLPRTELGTWYGAADLFVSCSPKESFGLVFVEALLFGLPVICDDFAEVRYVLKEHATYVKMTGLNMVADAIDEALKIKTLNEEKQWAEQRREFARSRYSLHVLKPDYISLFLKVIS